MKFLHASNACAVRRHEICFEMEEKLMEMRIERVTYRMPFRRLGDHAIPKQANLYYLSRSVKSLILRVRK